MSAPILEVDLSIRRAGGLVETSFSSATNVILEGPSGGGKSTVLEALAGIVPTASGRVRFRGVSWFDRGKGIDVAARQVGVVFQRLLLFPHRSPLENVLYGAPRGLDRRAARDRALGLLETFHAADLADRKTPTLSGGEAQRVALARAAGREPALFLLDEPFSSLDGELRERVAEALARFANSRSTPWVIAAHDAGALPACISARATIVRVGAAASGAR